MADLQFTPIDLPSSDHFTIVKSGINRKWKILTFILVVIILILTIIITIIVFKQSSSSRSDDDVITATTKMETSNTNSTDANRTLNITTTTEDLIDARETTVTSNYLPMIYTPIPVSPFSGFQTSLGLLLNHSLYFNINHRSDVTGYVISVTLRLFTSWEGDYPLYIYAIEDYSFTFVQITHRYPLLPARNTTEWQTIEIPFGIFPIYVYNFIAIGMQDQSETNQIYAVNSTISIHGENNFNDTREVFKKAVKDWYGAAFIYNVVSNDKKLF